jgi:predicted protein tyrosine phosphatase
MFNRIVNCKNRYQGSAKRVLCVCSAGLLRSPTLAWVLSNPPYNYNTRAVGVNEDFALIPMDDVHINWADAIFFVEDHIYQQAKRKFDGLDSLEIVTLNIPDMYEFKHPKLIELIHKQLEPYCSSLLTSKD